MDTNNVQVGINFPTDSQLGLVLLVQISVASVDTVESAKSFLAWSKVAAFPILE